MAISLIGGESQHHFDKIVHCITDGITQANLQMKLTKYTKDYLPIVLEPKVITFIY
jgi:hypothetical protein